MEHLSLRAFCDWSLEEGGSFIGDPEGYVEKVGVMSIFVNTGPLGKPERGPLYQGFCYMPEWCSRSGSSL
jgi:hypothetical protein